MKWSNNPKESPAGLIMISRHILPYLRDTHGLYNILIALLFFYQGHLGFAIRRQRKAGKPISSRVARRHRKFGPFLVIMAILGFIAGLTLVLIDKGNVFEYPLHLFAGVTIVLLVSTSYGISKKIKGKDSPFRPPHFIIGIKILTVYLIAIFLGLGILL